MSEAPAELWLRQSRVGWHQSLLDPPEPDAVRYVRADLYEALLERVNQLWRRAQQEPLGELGTDYPR